MFTGIVQGSFEVSRLQLEEGIARIGLAMPSNMRDGLEIGASVAVDGVCLTVTAIQPDVVCFDAIAQTLQLTTLGQLQQGDTVNVERSFKQGVEVGGHIVSGHIDGKAEIVAIEESANNRTFTYKLPSEFNKYVLNKGFVAVNGCSLTVAEVNKAEQTFSICYIPETLRVTTHGNKVVGDSVNIEVDRQTQAVVDTVERLLLDNPELITQVLDR